MMSNPDPCCYNDTTESSVHDEHLNAKDCDTFQDCYSIELQPLPKAQKDYAMQAGESAKLKGSYLNTKLDKLVSSNGSLAEIQDLLSNTLAVVEAVEALINLNGKSHKIILRSEELSTGNDFNSKDFEVGFDIGADVRDDYACAEEFKTCTTCMSNLHHEFSETPKRKAELNSSVKPVIAVDIRIAEVQDYYLNAQSNNQEIEASTSREQKQDRMNLQLKKKSKLDGSNLDEAEMTPGGLPAVVQGQEIEPSTASGSKIEDNRVAFERKTERKDSIFLANNPKTDLGIQYKVQSNHLNTQAIENGASAKLKEDKSSLQLEQNLNNSDSTLTKRTSGEDVLADVLGDHLKMQPNFEDVKACADLKLKRDPLCLLLENRTDLKEIDLKTVEPKPHAHILSKVPNQDRSKSVKSCMQPERGIQEKVLNSTIAEVDEIKTGARRKTKLVGTKKPAKYSNVTISKVHKTSSQREQNFNVYESKSKAHNSVPSLSHCEEEQRRKIAEVVNNLTVRSDVFEAMEKIKEIERNYQLLKERLATSAASDAHEKKLEMSGDPNDYQASKSLDVVSNQSKLAQSQRV